MKFLLFACSLILLSRYSIAVDCGGSLKTCGEQCYDENIYDCIDGIKLCPEAYLACGAACFNPSSYSCYQGQLVESSDNVCPSGQLTCDNSHICPRNEGVDIDDTRKGVFENLQKEEIEAVLSFLLADAALNLTAFEEADINTNYIRWMELWVPDKASVLDYLDNQAPQPGRFAQAIIYNGGKLVPDVRIIKVGPILSSEDMSWEILDLYGESIPWLSRVYDTFELAYIDLFVQEEFKIINSIIRESFGAGFYNCSAPSLCLSMLPTGPLAIPNTRSSWLWFVYSVPGMYLTPAPIEVLVIHEGTDPSKYRLVKIVYNYQVFNSTQELLDAYVLNQVSKVTPPAEIQQEPVFSEYNVRPETHPRKQDKAPPRHYAPEGNRLTVNNTHVEYMGWEFDYSIRPSSGLQLWDIRFKGERIIYELGVQESATTYSGYDAARSWAAYTDTTWELGLMVYELKDGVDCPANSVYLDVVHYFYGQPKTYKNAVCIFERDDAQPLIRHYESDLAGGFTTYSGTPSYSLVIRTIATIYNYDFIYDYTFHLNGVIAVSVAATGYIQTAWYNAEEKPYSTRIEGFSVGALHDHMANFKVDLDLRGTKNSFQVSTLEKELAYRPWFDEPIYQKRLVRRILQNEDESGLKFNFTNPTLYSCINADVQNKWGVPKGYAIVVKDNYNNVLGDTPVHRAWEWSKYQIAVTQRKDSEPHSSTPFNQVTATNPILSFDSFFNGESLVQEDLVVWVTVGVLHLPHSEDIPITPVTTIGGHLKFLLKPNNYFDEDPSLDLKASVIIKPGANANVPDIIEYDGVDNVTATCRPNLQYLEYDGWLR